MAKPAAKRIKAAASPARKAVRKAPVAAGDAVGAEDAVGALATAVASLKGALSDDRLTALPPELLQQMMAALIRAYSAKVQAGESFLPYDDRTGRVAPTDVMITASGLLKAADLQVFELGMWQSYTGR